MRVANRIDQPFNYLAKALGYGTAFIGSVAVFSISSQVFNWTPYNTHAAHLDLKTAQWVFEYQKPKFKPIEILPVEPIAVVQAAPVVAKVKVRPATKTKIKRARSVKLSAVVVNTQPAAAIVDMVTPSVDAADLRAVYFSLRREFIQAALLPRKLDIQVAKMRVTGRTLSNADSKVDAELDNLNTHDTFAAIEEESYTPVTAPPKEVQAQVAVVEEKEKPSAVESAPAPSVEEVASVLPEMLILTPLVEAPVVMPSYKGNEVVAHEAEPVVSNKQEVQVEVDTQPVLEAETAPVALSVATPEEKVSPPAAVVKQPEFPAQAVIATVTPSVKKDVSDKKDSVKAIVSTQPLLVTQASPKKNEYSSRPSVVNTQKAEPAVSTVMMAAQPAPQSKKFHKFFEAFNQASLGIEKTSVKTLSYEGSMEDRAQGWSIVQAETGEAHFKTLFWNERNDAQRVPLLANNTALWLGAFSGINLQSDAGLVFGKMKANQLLQISGRSENVMIFDKEYRSLESNQLDQAEYFAFLNVQPGANVITVSNQVSKMNSGVAFPVMPGIATYLDLSVTSNKDVLQGRVLDASSTTSSGIRSIQVSIVGFGETSAFTNENGAFKFKNIQVTGNYPLYIETDGQEGFRHRYRVLPNKLSRMKLYRFANYQVGQWVEQLQGGLSSQGGLVVGAMPGFVQPGIDSYPIVRPLSNQIMHSVEAETYTLAEDDQLLVKSPLENEQPRFIGVQVPEGPTMVEIENSHVGIVWSQLVFSSPGVINVITP